MDVIDLDTWPRASTFELFRGYADPFFDLAVRVGAAGVREAAKARGHSPFGVILHALMAAANDVPELRTRIRGDTVVRHGVVHPSWVVLADDGTMRFANGRYDEDLGTFLASVASVTAAAQAKPSLTDAHTWDDFLYVSAMPRLDLLGVRTERSGKEGDSVPHVVWGKIVDGSFGLTVSAHHGLVDGLHIERLVVGLEQRLTRYAAR